MSDINLGVCSICRQQFDLSDGVPCDCLEKLEEDLDTYLEKQRQIILKDDEG